MRDLPGLGRTVLYLHGFRSSPDSFKASRLRQRYHELGRQEQFLCPQLPVSPAAAMAMIRGLVAAIPSPRLAVIGSSLGGFYATALAEERACRSVLLNPAIYPARDLARYIGELEAWHSEQRLHFLPEYIDELEALQVTHISQDVQTLLVAATGDEVLDWREMTARYPHAQQRVIQGSDHALSDFDQYIDEVIAFCET